MRRQETCFNVVDADLKGIQDALAAGKVTSVELVAEYLRRISIYDCRGPQLNSIPLINQDVFIQAAESDDRRARGDVRSDVEGIPFTVKDSFKVRGMTVASGSPAFKNLQSSDDAFTVQVLRHAGAVLIGKTNMPPMAFGGMQRGVYGRAESPYNLEYLAAAFASGSSNGSGVSTSASFAAFGLGEETVSSGRSPASNNSIIAYTPSRGYISIRGNWPLYPTCDVVVPHTRTMNDLFGVLDIITQPDPVTKGDFWRHQTVVELPRHWSSRPNSFYDLKSAPMIPNLRLAVPDIYINGTSHHNEGGVYVSEGVRQVWQRAKADLENLGAEVVLVPEFPLVMDYEAHLDINAGFANCRGKGWRQVERGLMPALAWEEFLRDNNDPSLKTLYGLLHERIWPFCDPEDPQLRFSIPENAIHWSRLTEYIENCAKQSPPIRTHYQIPNLESLLTTLERMRKVLFDDWMTTNGFDFVVFPAAGDVARADSDINLDSAKFAWTNGVKYSNGNQVLRHLGVPSVTVPMGIIEAKQMPVGLTILARGYDDTKLLTFSYQYERVSKRRMTPPLTPALEPMLSMRTNADCPRQKRLGRPRLCVEQCVLNHSSDLSRRGLVQILAHGTVEITAEDKNFSDDEPTLEIFVDGVKAAAGTTSMTRNTDLSYGFRCCIESPQIPVQRGKERVEAKIARDLVMVMMLARTDSRGRPTGWLGLLE